MKNKFRNIILPIEPTADDIESIEFVFRMPLSGERIKRRFKKDEKMQSLYDFIDHLQKEGKCKFEEIDEDEHSD